MVDVDSLDFCAIQMETIFSSVNTQTSVEESPVTVQDRFHLLSASRLPVCFGTILVSLAHTSSTGVQVKGPFKSGHHCYRAVRFGRERSHATRSYCRHLAGTTR